MEVCREEAAPGGVRALMLVWKYDGLGCGGDGVNPPWCFQGGFLLSGVICSLEKLEMHPRWEQQEGKPTGHLGFPEAGGDSPPGVTCRVKPADFSLKSDTPCAHHHCGSDLSIVQTFLVSQGCRASVEELNFAKLQEKWALCLIFY